MIAARQIAFGKAGAKKPYDAEVEYLEINETPGQAFINTGLIPDDKLSFEAMVRVCAYANAAAQVVIGCGWGNWYGSDVNVVIIPATIKLQTNVAGSSKQWVQLAAGETLDVLVSGSFRNGTLTVEYEGNSWTKTPTASNLATWRTPLHLFCGILPVANTDDYSTFNHAYKGTRIYWLKAQNDARRIDLIPVRVGNVGYMYDRVSGQLFGNQGTGEFVLGDDI